MSTIENTAPGWRILDARWDGKSVFSVEEAAEILRLSRDSAYAGVKDGSIPAVKRGRRYIVPRIALERKLSIA